MTEEKKLKQLWEAIQPDDRIAIFGHRNPDGDALGSTLALSGVLQQMGIKNHVIMPNPAPESFGWMPGIEHLINYDEHSDRVREVVQESEWLFFLDFNTPPRLGRIERDLDFDLGKAVIIDHHPDPDQRVAYLFSDTTRSSTCEYLYALLKKSSLRKHINADVANCIFTGLITDTGGFNHNSSSPDFFRTIADLIELGADKDAIYQKVFHTQNESRFRLLGTLMHQNMTLDYDNGVGLMWLNATDLKQSDFKIGDTEGFVNMPLSIDGINKSVLVMEMEDEIKLSFRSRKEFVVNDFAATYFNGGGHKNAAGGYSHESFEKTMEKLRSHLHLL